MQKFKIWLNAARIRTLPLSLAGVLAGTAIARWSGYQDTALFLLTLCTTLAYQVTSNFANDYGDGVKGTDNDSRIGPARVLQSGALAGPELKRGVLVAAGISGLFTLATLYRAFGGSQWGYLLVFLLLGGLAIWASIRYTVGERAYGYRGLGDLFVFLFFGLVSVQGTQFLYTREVLADAWLPALAIGLLSVGVLNLNNLRDREPDRASGKRTLVVIIGYENGRRYHYLLCTLSFLAMGFFVLLEPGSLARGLCLLPYTIIFRHLVRMAKIRRPADLDPELKKVALSTFFIGLLLYIASHNFL
ncbi:1,4-dihydroxy-2-naphthoate octaprenyltransferase [Robiginitalea sp. SC105]|uniref:1,4-dihydroxy-2-naphthoate octaprenyltransferase n=1 Tax=Robiginitalea sp. SC105 TaxID=2762332 RepID=UPI00163AE4B6|nr:1,4-dihydroxy-2-naphthoate octaprenyltransferase [Robiginitalea sp. SC105]MBC2840707.1 1,4-dihydroxy-2-naphthoate octaprenyltransferase [Robiginitalea sp. SC105]